MPVSFETLLAFAMASFLLIIIPGPTVITVVTQAFVHGRRVALASVLGVGLGDLGAATLSVIGVGALLATSAAVFTAVKWLGAGYLIYLGIRMWRSRAPSPAFDAVHDTPSDASSSRLRLMREAFLVTLFNPKGIIFFVAFLPQFIETSRAFAPQAAMLVATFVLIAMANIYGYILLANRARDAIARPGVLRVITRSGGAMLVMAGVTTLLTNRA
ncbi:LysE family translocator [Pararhizobium haloflavum]|uniref:LysE family translocator n=1 Tax=Pararhizobium haloflavum TaxID=2037914 RepID=UPI000C1A352A|nr:LysE family translocator [Pararhizobium haloflavum]